MTTAFPDQTMVLASHGRRLAAAALDAVFSTFVIGGCGAAGFAVGVAGASGNSDADSDGWEALGWILLGSFVGLLVGAVVWLALTVWLVRRRGARNGQTLGKQLLDIRAARANRREIGIGTALLREILAKGMLIGITASIVSTVLGFLDAGLVGLLVAVTVWYGPAFVDDQQRALHDRLCGTRVVDAGYAPLAAMPPTDDDLCRAGGVTPADLVFRRATADDAPRLAALVIEGFETYRAFAPQGWEVPPLADELQRVTATLAKPSCWCRLAEEGERLAGHVGFLAAAESRLPDGDAGLGHFWQLFVRRDLWGSGLATTLHSAAMRAAAERGYRAVRLFAAADHARARRFYEREGWSLHRAPFDDPHFGMMLAEYRRAP